MSAVSVIVPVYNNETSIGAALDSVLGQQFEDFELIAVDDGSTDGSARILESYGTRIKVVRQPNSGPAAARNAGCAMASGHYLAFLDADDTWTPHKLATTVPVLERNREVVLVFSDATPIDATGLAMSESYVRDLGRAPSMSDLLTRWWPILPSTAVLRCQAFAACGGFIEEFRSAAYEDPFLWLLMREQGEFRYVPERLVYYREESVGRRMEKYRGAQELYIRRVRERYGDAADALIRSTRRAYATALSHEGLLALRTGDRASARRYFARALRDRPAELKNILRLLRTFMPLRIAHALSGRTGQPHKHTPA